MRKMIMILLALLFTGVTSIAGYITWFGLRDQLQQADLIVVFGNEVYGDGSLSPRLQARMDKAIELFSSSKQSILFVSGAMGKAGVEESAAMKAYAIAKLVPDARIVTDPLGINTSATAKNAVQFMREHNLHSAMLVSQFFHLARATVAFKNHDVWNIGHAHADYFELRDLYSLAREVVALPTYALGIR